MSKMNYNNFNKIYWDNLNVLNSIENKVIKDSKKKNKYNSSIKVLNNRKNIKQTTEINFSKIYTAVSLLSLFFLSIILTSSFISSMPAKKNSLFKIINIAEQNPAKILEDFLLFNEDDNSERVISNIFNKVNYFKYRVQKNDTIEKIAKKFKVTSDTILLANNIKKSRNLRAGTLLTIPDQNGRVVIVKNNDSILKFAKIYGISWEKISDANDLESSVIHPGSKLFIPESQMTKYEKNQYYEQIFIWPVKGRITSYFGSRIDPFTGIYGFHTGIDIKCKIGTKVACVKDGKVVFTGYQKVYGNFIMVKHSDNVITTYAHLDKIEVQKNMEIKQGDYLGTVGTSGRTTGPHLHFEVTKNGKYIDPLTFLR
ncbi:MAG: M23 family metallopeptidase [Spirochaetes bacterium]|nr:M23 family metallopeptidase [Spirochaetota bacterium]